MNHGYYIVGATHTGNTIAINEPATATATATATETETELLNFALAMAEQFGLPTPAQEALQSGDQLQVRAALTNLATRVGQSVDAIAQTGDNYDAIKARFVQDLAYLKSHYGFGDVIKVMRELTASVALDELTQERERNAGLRTRCVDLEKRYAVAQAQLESRLDNTLRATGAPKRVTEVAVDDMSGDDL